MENLGATAQDAGHLLRENIREAMDIVQVAQTTGLPRQSDQDTSNPEAQGLRAYPNSIAST